MKGGGIESRRERSIWISVKRSCEQWPILSFKWCSYGKLYIDPSIAQNNLKLVFQMFFLITWDEFSFLLFRKILYWFWLKGGDFTHPLVWNFSLFHPHNWEEILQTSIITNQKWAKISIWTPNFVTPCVLSIKSFGSDNFSNTIGQTSLNNFSNTIGQTSLNNFSNTTSLNNVFKGPSVLPIISLSDLIVMQRQVENIGKSKTG